MIEHSETARNSTTVKNCSVKGVLFSAGSIHLIIERRYIVAMASVHERNHSDVWIKDTPKMSVEKLLGLESLDHTRQHHRCFLIMNNSNGMLTLEVDEPVELIDISLDTLHLLPVLIASRINLPCIKAIVALKKGLGLFLDPENLPTK